MTQEPTDASADEPESATDDPPVVADGGNPDRDSSDGDDDAPSAGPGRGRTISIALLGVVSVVLLYGSLLGFWTIRTATDSERFEERIEEILQSEEVSDALARVVLGEIEEVVDVRGEVAAITPDALDPVVDLLFAGVQSRLEDLLAATIRQPAVSSNVAAAAGQAHELAIKVLEGDSIVDGVQIDDGRVRINLVPLAARAFDLLPDVGVFSGVDIPEFDRGGNPDAQVAELEAALGRDLPDNFAQPVIFTSTTLEQAGDTVDTARSILLLAKRSFWLLLIAGLGVGGVAIWMSQRRIRTSVFLVAGLLVTFGITAYITESVASRVPNAVVNPGASATVDEVVRSLQRDLHRMLLLVSVVAVAGVAAAIYFDRRSREAESVDDRVTPTTESV